MALMKRVVTVELEQDPDESIGEFSKLPVAEVFEFGTVIYDEVYDPEDDTEVTDMADFEDPADEDPAED